MPRTNADLTKQPPEFYKQFNLIICGLDSIDARRWINRYVRNRQHTGTIRTPPP